MVTERIRAIAQAATPGPWKWQDSETDVDLDGYDREYIDATADGFGRPSLRTAWVRETEYVGAIPEFIIGYAEEVSGPDAQHIATFDPLLVTAMLDVVEAARVVAEPGFHASNKFIDLQVALTQFRKVAGQ